MKKRYNLKLLMENFLNEEEMESREQESERYRNTLTYPDETTEDMSIERFYSKAVGGKFKGEIIKRFERVGDFRAKYYGKSKGKKPGSVTFRYENNEIINRDGKTGKNHFLNVLDLGFPNGYSMQIIRDTMMPEKVAYSGFGDGKLKFKGKFDKKVKRELYDQMKKQDLINLEGAPGEKDLFNRIAGAINGVFIDSERDKALAGLEKEMEDYDKINESLSRGSLYRKRYFGRY